MSVSIYVFIDPTTEAICYVGQTVDMGRRLAEHAGQQGANASKCDWFDNLVDSEEIPLMVEIDCVDPSEANLTEQMWIHQLLADGHPLLNAAVSNEPPDPDRETQRIAAKDRHLNLLKAQRVELVQFQSTSADLQKSMAKRLGYATLSIEAQLERERKVAGFLAQMQAAVVSALQMNLKMQHEVDD